MKVETQIEVPWYSYFMERTADDDAVLIERFKAAYIAWVSTPLSQWLRRDELWNEYCRARDAYLGIDIFAHRFKVPE